MSKIVAGTVFVLLTGATATGGVLLAKQSGKEQATQETEPANITLPTTLDEFKASGKDVVCVKSLFSGLESIDGSASTASASGDITSEYFGNGEDKPTKGCLVVNWDKDTYTNSKWRGTVRFLWTASGDNRGFLVFLVGTASNNGTAQEIKGTGVAYTLAYEGESGGQSWKFKKKKDVSGTEPNAKSFKKENGGDNNKFPGPGTALSITGNPNFGTFFADSNALANICSSAAGSSECSATPAPTKTSLKGHWDWAGKYGETATDPNKKMSDWTQNLETGWNEIFGSEFPIKNVAEKQVGIWTQRTYSPNPLSSAA